MKYRSRTTQLNILYLSYKLTYFFRINYGPKKVSYVLIAWNQRSKMSLSGRERVGVPGPRREQWALINFRSDKPTQQKKLLYGILVSRGDMNTCAYPFWHVVRRSHFAYTVIHSTLHAPPPAQIATLYWYFQLSQSLLSTPLLRLLLIQWRPGKSRGRREPPPPFPWKFPDLKLGISLSLSLLMCISVCSGGRGCVCFCSAAIYES